MIEDIPIFYLCSRDRHVEHYWWGFTGELGSTHGQARRSRVYFTDEFLRELVERTCTDTVGRWELSSSGVLDRRLKTFEGWVVKWKPPHKAG